MGARAPRSSTRQSLVLELHLFPIDLQYYLTYGQQATRIIYYLRLSVIILDAYFGIDRMAKEEE